MKKLIVWAAILATLGYFGSKLLLHHKVEKGVDSAILAASPFVKIEYEGVSSTLSGELTIDGIRAQIDGFNDSIFIERLGIDTPSYFTLLGLTNVAEKLRNPDDVIPKYFGIIADGVRVPVYADYLAELYQLQRQGLNASDADEPATRCAGKYGYSPQALADLGYSEQVASFSAHFRRGRGSYSMSITSSIEEMWDVKAELSLAGQMAADFSKGARYRPRMRALQIEYKDRSLNRRVKQYCAELGLSEQETLQAQLAALNFFGKENGIEFDEYVIDPYTEFLNGKTTLIITAEPSEPVSISQISLYKPSDVPALLALSAEAF